MDQVSDQCGVLSKRGSMFFFFPPYKFHKIFTIDVITHVECFCDDYEVIDHVVWQPCWKKGKTLDFCILETAPWEVLLMGKKFDII